MKSPALILIVGFLVALLFILVSWLVDGTGYLHWLRDIFIQPPLYVVQTVADILELKPGNRYTKLDFFVLYMLTFWWLLNSVFITLVGKCKHHLTNRSSR